MTRREFFERAGLFGLMAAAPASLTTCGPGSTTTSTPPWEWPPNALGITWGRLSPFGISITSTKWNSGRVNDVLPLPSGGVVVAVDAGGVWYVSEPSGVFIDVSHAWDSPDVRCVAQGPDGPTHVFAAGALGTTTDKGALYETDVTQAAPLVAPWTPITPGGVGAIYRMLVTADRKLVIATSNGIWWSPIPPAGSRGTGYAWVRATQQRPGMGGTMLPVGSGGAFWGIVQGPGASIVATAWPGGNFDSSNGHYGIFIGAWRSGRLVFTGITDSAITGNELASGGAVDQKAMFRISIDAFAGNRNEMWAVAADNTSMQPDDGAGQLYAVLRSHDGGATWQAVHAQLVKPDDPNATLRGAVGGWAGNTRNSAVAVGPQPQTVAIGWVYGPFISIDDGYTFAYHNDPDAGHSDYAMLRWTSSNRLYACTDGGIAYTDNLGATWETGLNRRLATMNFYSPTGGRELYGVLASSKPTSVGSQVVSVVAGGVQDNGDIWTRVIEGGDAEPWRHLRGGDGGPTVFVDDTLIEAAKGEGGDVFESDRWDGSAFGDQAVIPIAGGTDGLTNCCIAPVNAPTHAPDGSSIVAVAGYSNTDGSNNIHTVYGLIRAPNGTLSWSPLAQVPLMQSEIMASIASWSGSKIFFGLRGKASVYSFTVGSPAAPVKEMGFPDNGGRATAVVRIVLGGEDDAYALLVDWQNNVYEVYRHAAGASSWSEVTATGLPCLPSAMCPTSGSWPTNLLFSIEVDLQASPRVLFVATDDQVLAYTEGSPAWIDVSHGLPRRAHIADLRIVRDPDGTRHMLASTYGRSVWRATF